MTNSRSLTALRASILLLFLPAHLAFVLLVDLHFIPDASPEGALSITPVGDPGPKKDRLRVQLRRPSESRASATETRPAFEIRDLDPWALPPHLSPITGPGRDVRCEITRPASLIIWIAATPHSYRAPPA